MEYLEFLNAVKDHINASSADVSVCVHSALKNNGVKLSGLSFVKKGFLRINSEEDLINIIESKRRDGTLVIE